METTAPLKLSWINLASPHFVITQPIFFQSKPKEPHVWHTRSQQADTRHHQGCNKWQKWKHSWWLTKTDFQKCCVVLQIKDNKAQGLSQTKLLTKWKKRRSSNGNRLHTECICIATCRLDIFTFQCSRQPLVNTRRRIFYSFVLEV